MYLKQLGGNKFELMLIERYNMSTQKRIAAYFAIPYYQVLSIYPLKFYTITYSIWKDYKSVKSHK